MNEYVVIGAERATGNETTQRVMADNATEAEHKANAMGIVVSKVLDAHTPPVHDEIDPVVKELRRLNASVDRMTATLRDDRRMRVSPRGAYGDWIAIVVFSMIGAAIMSVLLFWAGLTIYEQGIVPTTQIEDWDR